MVAFTETKNLQKMYQSVFIKGLNMNHEFLMKALGEHVVIMFMYFHYASAMCVYVGRVGNHVSASSLLFLSMSRYHGELNLRTEFYNII